MRRTLIALIVAMSVLAAPAAQAQPEAPPKVIVVDFPDSIPAFYDPDLDMFCRSIADSAPLVIALGSVAADMVCEPAIHGDFGFGP